MLSGNLFLGAERRAAKASFRAYNPTLGAEIAEPAFAEATASDVADACARAEAAFEAYAARPLADRAAFLEAIANRIEGLGDALLERAHQETGLPMARLTGERGRTTGQLRLFAKEVLEGGWQSLRIDHADPARTPPKPDLRLRNIPLGTVVHAVELQPGGGAKIARSAGSSVQLVAKEGRFAQLRMPSGEIRNVEITCRATIGEVGNADHSNINWGKAGRMRWKGKRPHVRGVVMNPVDHPHGGGEGKTSGGRHPVSPWGQPEGRTRRPNKPSDKLIVRRRRTGKKR